MKSTQTENPRQPQCLRIDIVLSRDGKWWVADCLQFGMRSAGDDPNSVFEDMRKLCQAHVIFALNHDPKLETLFRPASAELMRLMSTAKLEGILEFDIQGYVAPSHSSKSQISELCVNRLKAA